MSKLEPKIIEAVRRYIAHVELAGIPVTETLVFGSRARGTHQPWSDIDIAVVSPTFGHNSLEEMGRLLVIAANVKAPWPIEPIPFSPEDLKDQWSTLATEVRRYGISVPQG